MTSPKPPPAPVISPIVPEIPDMPSKPMGRKGSSMFFHQPTVNRGPISSNVNSNNDRTLFISVNGDMLLDVGNLRTASTRRQNHPPALALEDIPDFSLPEPATTRSLVGLKRKADQSIAINKESLDLADNVGGKPIEPQGIKKRPLGIKPLPVRKAKQGKTVMFGETTIIPTKSMESLKLDDD